GPVASMWRSATRIPRPTGSATSRSSIKPRGRRAPLSSAQALPPRTPPPKAEGRPKDRAPQRSVSSLARFLLFAADTQARVGDRFQPFGVDRVPAPLADAVGPLFDLRQRQVDIVEVLAEALDHRQYLVAFCGGLGAVGEPEVEVE